MPKKTMRKRQSSNIDQPNDGGARPRGNGKHDRQRPTSGFWRKKGLEELASEQGVNPVGQLDRVLGKGAHLWESDAEFESFVQGIYDRRKEDRELSLNR